MIMDTEMKEYKGVKCTIVYGSNFKDNCYVANADRELGITIHDENDKSFFCLNKKELFNQSLKSRKDRNRVYNEAFSEVIKMIEKGIVYNVSFGNVFGFKIDYEFYHSGGSSLTCPFK